MFMRLLFFYIVFLCECYVLYDVYDELYEINFVLRLVICINEFKFVFVWLECFRLVFSFI